MPAIWWQRLERSLGAPRVISASASTALDVNDSIREREHGARPSARPAGALSAWPTLSRHVGEQLLAVAEAMADGSFYETLRDDHIELCGGSAIYEDWDTGEAGE